MKKDAGNNKAGKMVLLVEDDETNREIIAGILMDMGHMVIDKSDVASALAVVQEDTPIDLVLTDYRLPDSDSFALISTVRKAMPHVPIILMTAYGDVDTYIRSMSLGVYEYLNKPVNKKELERIISTALRKSFHEDTRSETSHP